MKNHLLLLLLVVLSYLFYLSQDFTTVVAGVAIFMIGMHFLEEGFKLFSGGTLEKVLKKTTNKLYKAIFSGFLSTAIVQSSSLISVITISFLSVGLIELSNAIGIIFGANIGTTATSWLVAYFGIKIKISAYALPLISFGIILRFSKKNGYKGLGNILLGLGFIFLGISYMKDGFETLKSSIDLAQFVMTGYKGILIYLLVGMFATVVIQSSSATMAIIITALATSQISYENALALAIGANIGTTVTAVLASITSNKNGRRLAMAHFVFNFITALIATIFIYQFVILVENISAIFMVASDNYVIKLAIFHTVFNLVGVILLSPFIGFLVKWLETLFISKDKSLKPKYLNPNSISLPETSLKVVSKEIEHFYDEVIIFIFRAFSLKPKNIKKTKIENLIEYFDDGEFDFEQKYSNQIKSLSAEILNFIYKAQSNLDDDSIKMFDKYRLAIEYLLSIVKDVKHIRKNLNNSHISKNLLQSEYERILKQIFGTIKEIENMKSAPLNAQNLSKLEIIKIQFDKQNNFANKKINELIENKKVDTMMTISLMNDNNYQRSIIKHFLLISFLLWVDDDLKELELSDEILDMLSSTTRYRRINNGKNR